ncbi:DUF3013 family protein [Jeotgalibaca caeni]|uniref:DUF3013 family protein n=1 Tax=Jeotgalibaca caeni TaxID=3028623 RepID=UPI00237E2FAE|nr:DUF3013 family protein [Jeotgalibaca caeni]MDE1547880.1 DUF3013 family protein [Jeotgalibaca caeni]
MQKSMISYIQETMEDLHFPCEWRIEWFKQKHMIELLVMIPVELEEGQKLTDRYGVLNVGSKFVFEDAILLYDVHLAQIRNDNYITAIEFDEPDGMYGGTIQALCKNLRLTVGQAITQLEEFIVDENQSRFEMVWNDDNFQATIKTLKDTGRFDYTIYSYPSDITEDVVGSNELE